MREPAMVLTGRISSPPSGSATSSTEAPRDDDTTNGPLEVNVDVDVGQKAVAVPSSAKSANDPERAIDFIVAFTDVAVIVFRIIIVFE
jgi:hypothetical protein